jgi:serine/threonine protein kinase
MAALEGHAMASPPSDDAFAKYVLQHTIATAGQIAAAREFQARCTRDGVSMLLADALIRVGAITPAQRDNVERQLQAQQYGIFQLLHYKFLRKLGEGGMGAVFLAEDTQSGRNVALKVLHRHFATNADFMKRFHREADAMGRLNHPNIVRAFSAGQDQGRHFIVMEYCEGETLDKRMKREGALPFEEATEIVTQVARGLQHAHAAGLVHRDVKPANVILAGGVAKLLDLGLSKNLEGMDQTLLTQTGVTVGTPHYMSPEQARGERDLDGRADIYSLGATYYHLVTGATPFRGSSAFEVITKHLNETFPDPRDIREGISDGTVHVIRKMLAKDREDRYRDCGELLGDLKRVKAGEEPLCAETDALRSSISPRRGRRPTFGSASASQSVPRKAAAAAVPGPPEIASKRAGVNSKAALLAGGVALAVLIVAAIFMTNRGPAHKTEAVQPPVKPVALNPVKPVPPPPPPIAAVIPVKPIQKDQPQVAPPGYRALFDGKDTSAWAREDGSPISWPVVDGTLEVGNGNIITRDSYQDFRLHVEFCLEPKANSGVYLQRRYEIDVLDSSYAYPSNRGSTCGSLVGQKRPDKNVFKQPGEWQSFDITFRAARFDAAGRKTENVRVTVVHNGVTIHENAEFKTNTPLGRPEGPDPGPVLLQQHTGKVRFRNIWIAPNS